MASGLSPYGGLYRVLSAPACGNRWGPSMDNLLPMCERKLSLPNQARSPLRRGLRFRRLAGRVPGQARLTITYLLAYVPNLLQCGYQGGSVEDVE